MEQFLQNNVWIVILLALWAIPWKGIALWKAARLSQKYWFIALLVVNTLAILEIIYIFAVAKKRESSSAEATEDAKSVPAPEIK